MAKILLAEDDHSMRKFLEMALRKAGHQVASAEDGLKALAAFNHDKSYDLLLADIVMPGMDGIELSQHVTQKSPDMKVMFITGFAAVTMGSTDVRHNNQEARVLSKPFHLKDLINRVDELLAA